MKDGRGGKEGERRERSEREFGVDVLFIDSKTEKKPDLVFAKSLLPRIRYEDYFCARITSHA